MNDFPAKRNLFFKGRDLYRFARLPSTLGNDARPMRTDVFGVSQLSRIDRMILNVGKMHNNSDRETLFHSSVESCCDGHMVLHWLRANFWGSGLVGHLLQLYSSGRWSAPELINIDVVRCQSRKNLISGSSKLTITFAESKLRSLRNDLLSNGTSM
jgi:hypothetical protein